MKHEESRNSVSNEIRMEASNFACPYCTAVFEAYEEIKKHILLTHRSEAPPEPEGTIHITVNGQKYTMQAAPEWTLHYLLHDKLGLTGTKLMCDRRACGSCPVPRLLAPSAHLAPACPTVFSWPRRW